MKQFSKFKQFADKAFVRTDRTEVMSEDLLEADRHIELMKTTCETTVKKMGACVQNPSSQNKEEFTKRIKKVPEYALGSSMDDLGKKYDEGSVLGVILGEAGKIEMTIGAQMLAHEGKIEPIIADLQKLVDTEFPNVYKMKRNLAKLSENMDSAKSKLQQANRHSMSASTGGKIDNWKDELEESQQKVEQCRDSLASEMYQLLSRETDIAQSIVQFLRYQQEYHQTISNTLSNLLPEVDAALANASHKPVYGTDLAEHLTASGRTIAYPLELCVCGLLETALKEEGLFRIAGSASKVKKLKSAFNAWLIDLKGLMGEFSDPHVIGNALKCYLRELPNPLLTLELYGEWIDAIRVTDNQEKLQSLWNVVQKLPTGNRENLRYLVKFLRKLSDHQDINKMSSANIAIVLGPNLLWTPSTSDDSTGDTTPMGLNMVMTHWFSSIVEQLVTYADWFFPGELDFFVTCEKPEPEWVSVNLRRTPAASMTSGQNALANGSSAEDVLDDNQMLKRSQSNSSLDEHPVHNGSPKPVIRRKVKPAPLPPTITSKNSSEHSTFHIAGKPVVATYQSQPVLQKPIDTGKVTSTKREGMWIPPSPSQMTNRTSYLPPSSTVPTASATTKVVPPKPPQPNFLKDKGTGVESVPTGASTLRHKSSFRSPTKVGTKDGVETSPTQTIGSASLQYSASLPRHFHTENSYKAKGSSNHALTKKDSKEDSKPYQSKQEPLPNLTKPESPMTEEMTKVKETVPPKPESSPLIGFEIIESEVRGTIRTETRQSPPVESKLVSPIPQPTTTEHVRPVPAPRSSLLKELTPVEAKGAKERPSVKAKPRDLGKRTHGEVSQSFQSHSRNSSGSGLESEGEIVSDGKISTPTSAPHSRAHSRTDSIVEEKKSNEGIISGQGQSTVEVKGAIVPEDDLGNESTNGGLKAEVSPKMPYRPPRPHPPPPPNKGKSGESTDF